MPAHRVDPGKKAATVTELPTTRRSLLIRVRDPRDHGAWAEFESIYRPAVYRFARRRGLQPADAEDLSQRVFQKTAHKVSEWDEVGKQGSFRAWILLVTRNEVINALSRKRPDAATGGTSTSQFRVNEIPESQPLDELLEKEYRRATFRHAASIVQNEFTETSWRAFWLTTVENQQSKTVSESLGISIGALYAARSRIMSRLREVVTQLTKEDE
ncbi:RNA polymerase sigma factor [Thalassoglobus sp.]|uniref:RNA polymerase sigma factor n=1 Tax=Thalassoglobus sp. TaxID=2795869 RepID=UPI003AA84CB1